MKILVAEDELDIAEMYLTMLRDRGHDVTVTHDGSKCIKTYRDAIEVLDDTSEEYLSENPPFDVVVLDFKMPNMDGLQTAKLILVANKHQRIIFASAFAKDTLKESVKHLRAVVELLPKPFDYQVLVDIIENVGAHEDLKKINAILDKQEQIQVEQLWATLKTLKKSEQTQPA